MALLIDGYNLLHASGILGRGRGPGGFERSREALLNFLVASIDPKEIKRTTVVFDATQAPPGLPRTVDHDGITVRFAPRDATADEMIAELILAHSTPRRLTVVSSDHQVQRAARRRKAIAVDSDIWYAEVLNRRLDRQHGARQPSQAKPASPLSPQETAFWVKQFEAEEAQRETSPQRPGEDASQERAGRSDSSAEQPRTSVHNPFPPGYAEDIDEDDV